jgi:hypothetical protein
MPRFTTITCLLAFITNAVLGGMGGVLLCAHDTGGTHWFEPTEHDESSHGPCCHHERGPDGDIALEIGDCASCEDTLLTGLSKGVFASGQERPSLKAPVSSALRSDEIRAAANGFTCVCAAGSIRAPAVVANARCAFIHTIRILC